jgi:hypothetical protein
MDHPWILKAIAVFAAILILDAVLFIAAKRRNVRMARRIIRVEQITTQGWEEEDNK